jgi:hypothetical protein
MVMKQYSRSILSWAWHNVLYRAEIAEGRVLHSVIYVGLNAFCSVRLLRFGKRFASLGWYVRLYGYVIAASNGEQGQRGLYSWFEC